MAELLPSWRDTATRDRIVEFVEAVTGDGPDAVPAVERVAVFDNDGTLWTEKPMPTQLHYIVQQWAAAAEADPTLAERQPYQAVVTGDLRLARRRHRQALRRRRLRPEGDDRRDPRPRRRTTSVEDYDAEVAEFYRDAPHLDAEAAVPAAVYQPMVELLRYLEAHGFTCYIVSGGDRDFMRPMTSEYYGIPPERVVGSALGLATTAERERRAVRGVLRLHG